MKGEGKHFCQLGRKILERAQMKRKQGNKYSFLASGRGASKWGRKNGITCGKKDRGSKCSCVYQCCSGKAALHNYENFRKSSVPMTVMYFWNGSWNDFSAQVLDSLRVEFLAGMPTVELVIDGSPYLVDFLRMLQIDLRAGCQRSIAWIDKNGSCFFPKFIIEGNVDEEVTPKVEVEIEIRISPTEASNAGNCDRVAANMEVSKTEQVCFPGNFGVSKTQKNSLPGHLKHLSKVPNLKPVADVVSMNGPKLDELIKKSSTDGPTGANDLSKDPKPEPVTELPINGFRAKQLLHKTSTEVLTGTDELERGLSDAGLSKLPRSQLANETLPRVLTGATQSGNGNQVLRDEVGGGVVNHNLLSESQQCSSFVACEFEQLGDKLTKLMDCDKEYVAVKNCFLTGLNKIGLATNVTGIYRNSHTGRLGQARLQVFNKQVEITTNSRGNANVKYAWHGASSTCISSIILHGFSNNRLLDGGPAYGVGVYLAPEDCSYLSVPFSDLDINGEQYVVLCRVILGNVEEVPLGSHQFHPSCEKFDSGINDITNPKHYIIWSTHMNTHILPEYVVSFKAPHQSPACSDGLKANEAASDTCRNTRSNLQYAQVANKFSAYEMEPCTDDNKENQRKIQVPRRESVRMPSSAHMPFMKLLSVIGKFLPTATINSLEHLYTGYKAGRISRDVFIRKVRMIAGDKLLIEVIRNLQGQKDKMQVARADRVPQSLLDSTRTNMDNQSTLLMGQAIQDGESQG